MKNNFENYLNSNKDYDYQRKADLKAHCWYQIGGPADYLIYPKNRNQLRELISICAGEDIPYFLLGSGANLLISDAGFRGVVIKLNRYFNQLERLETEVSAAAGVELDKLVLFCEENGLAGMAELSGIPGTVGGALSMNAGTDSGVIGDVVKEVEVLENSLKYSFLKKAEIGFGYRSAPLLQNKIIISCKLEMKAGDPSQLKRIRQAQLLKRKTKQPLNCPSCGSVFKRPPGNYAGKLIEEAGLKGYRYGNAQISPKHAGFIVNLGNATAAEVKFLMDKIQEEVYKKFSVKLEPEVRFLGF
jgi:UDP-N-acetylmuramate dehydrogenase